jgi:hypothetical protein
MDTFSRHHEAAKLLATAARQVAGSVKAVHTRYRRKEPPAGIQTMAEELLNLIQGALQLAAAAEHTSRTILARTEDSAKPKATKVRGRQQAAKGSRNSGRKTSRTS